MSPLVASLGWLGTLCSTFMMVPQMIKIVRGGDTAGVSAVTCVLYGIGSIVWTTYGVATHDAPLAVSSGLSLVPTAIIVRRIFMPRPRAISR